LQRCLQRSIFINWRRPTVRRRAEADPTAGTRYYEFCSRYGGGNRSIW
jgi:hypothetical protein